MDKKNNNGWIVFLSLFLSFCFVLGILFLQFQIRKIHQKQKTMIEMENIQLQKEQKDEKEESATSNIAEEENYTIELTPTKTVSTTHPSSTKKTKLKRTTAVFDTTNKTTTTAESETTKVIEATKQSGNTKNDDEVTIETEEPSSKTMPPVLVVNLKTKKIHSASCPLLKNQNTDYITEIRSAELEDYLFEGYTFCSKCKGDIYAK